MKEKDEYSENTDGFVILKFLLIFFYAHMNVLIYCCLGPWHVLMVRSVSHREDCLS